MAEEKKEVTQEVTEKPIEKKEEQPRNKKGQFESKLKINNDDNVIKVDLSKPPPTEQSEEVEQQPAEDKQVDVVTEDKLETTEELSLIHI